MRGLAIRKKCLNGSDYMQDCFGCLEQNLCGHPADECIKEDRVCEW